MSEIIILLEKRELLGDLCVCGRILLELMLKKRGLRVGTELNWGENIKAGSC
jgi:hypothetical protein